MLKLFREEARMPQYGRFSLATSAPVIHRFLVLMEEQYDVIAEVRQVATLEVNRATFVHADEPDLKPRFFRLTIQAERLEIVLLVRTIIPAELLSARQAILAGQAELLRTASDPDRSIAAITARRPQLNEPREVSFTPRVAKVWEALQSLAQRHGTPRCRPLLRQRYGSFADQAFRVFTDAGLVWTHPLTDLTFVARRVKVNIKQPLNV